MNQLEIDYNHCHNIMKEHSKTFSYAFDFLDLKRKKAIWAIYAVCRIIDDSIDKYKDIEQLDKIARDLDIIYSNYIQEYQSDAAIMNALSNTLDTYEYCYGVAGTVGELLTPILTSSNENNFEQAEGAAIALGKAMQITNILRDVGEDFQNGRIYLSVEKLAQYRVNLHSIYYEGITPNYIELWESYATEAVRLYDIALNGINYFDEEVRYIIELAAIAYHEILVEVRKANYTLHKKVYVSKLKKMKIYRELSTKYNRSETL